ncbi:MAG: ketoacyl-ACP synthase III [Leptolyngbya sp. PLA3]|nr:MAG: ketoacyl-ACP synthase III [Cyanobacteria bacterium CYA]MCE7968156.1 ketoacyl-ACP synthase III [Leptolyngbya sp. PL-A3]
MAAVLRPVAAACARSPREGTSAISGLGYYLPTDVITNADLSTLVDTSDEWITERTGIHSRRRADKLHATSDLGFSAATAALEDAHLTADDLDMILVATATPDSPVPATACIIQKMLGALGAAAMDINAGCSGFLYGLHTADAFVRAGAARNVLVIGAEILTRVTDYSDRRTCILFGDGAGACVVSRAGAYELLYTSAGADGTQLDLISIPAGGSRNPASSATVAERQHYLKLDGGRVFRQAVRRMVEAGEAALKATGLTSDDIAWAIPHQANARIISAVGEQLGIAVPKVVMDVAEVGNTSAASVPIALTRARNAGSFAPGQRVLLLAFGAGLTWACQIVRVGEAPSRGRPAEAPADFPARG